MIEKETGLLVQNRAWGDLGDWLGLEDEKMINHSYGKHISSTTWN